MLSFTSPFHVGLVVPDVDEARRSMEWATGATWSDPVERDRTVWTIDGGEVEVHFKVSHSDTPFQIELVQEVPGTIWTCPPNGALHHLGYWSEDLAADSTHLESGGLPVVARTGTWVYHRLPLGFYIELLVAKDRRG